MKAHLLKLKEEQKQLALEIKYGKSVRKKVFQAQFPERLSYLSSLNNNRYWYRHNHIAYCLLRGKKYEEIEQPALNNPPNMQQVQRIMEALNEQALRHSS